MSRSGKSARRYGNFGHRARNDSECAQIFAAASNADRNRGGDQVRRADDCAVAGDRGLLSCRRLIDAHAVSLWATPAGIADGVQWRSAMATTTFPDDAIQSIW